MFVKVLVGAVLIGLLLIGFWVVMWQPVNNEIVSLNTQIAQEQAKYNQYQQEAQNLEKWEQAKVAFQNVLSKLHQTASIKDFIPSFLTDIEKLAANERSSAGDPNFRVTSITPGTVEEQGSSGGAQTGAQSKKEGAQGAEQQPAQVTSGTTLIQLNFTGRFNTIVDFLQQLGNFKLNKLVTIQKISLSPQAPKPGLSPVLNVTMPFQVYMLGGG